MFDRLLQLAQGPGLLIHLGRQLGPDLSDLLGHLGRTPIGGLGVLLEAVLAILKLLLDGRDRFLKACRLGRQLLFQRIDLGLLVVQRALETVDVPALGLQLPEDLREVLTFDFAEAGFQLGATLPGFLQLAAELFILTPEVPGRRPEIRLRRAGDEEPPQARRQEAAYDPCTVTCHFAFLSSTARCARRFFQ